MQGKRYLQTWVVRLGRREEESDVDDQFDLNR